MSLKILIVYDSRHGNTAAMARQIARGVGEADGCEALLRCVAPDEDGSEEAGRRAPAPTADELTSCDGLILGSPTRFGNMSAPMKAFLDGTSAQWLSGSLVGKPGAVFASTGSMHGGQEATLLSMMIPLLHHGMLIVGLPYTNAELMESDSGGTPYGPTHVAGPQSDRPLTREERRLCRALGRRMAEVAGRLG